MVDNTEKKEIGRRLKSLKDAAKVSVEKIAEECGVSVQGVYKWFRTGEVAREHLPTLAKLLQTTTDDILHGEGGHPQFTSGSYAKSTLIRAFHPEDPAGDEEIRVQELRVEASGGHGRSLAHETIDDREPATYRLSWFQKEQINPEKARRFRVVGRSMEPMFFPGDSILVNLEETDVKSGFIYVFRHGDELKVKQLLPRPDGTLVLRSVNGAEFPDDVLPPAAVADQITIIGRVRDRSGRGGLAGLSVASPPTNLNQAEIDRNVLMEVIAAVDAGKPRTPAEKAALIAEIYELRRAEPKIPTERLLRLVKAAS